MIPKKDVYHLLVILANATTMRLSKPNCKKDFQYWIKTFSDWTAQIIQHEVDHCNGIII